MSVSRAVRAGGAFGQLLLVAVLALGVFAMHTVGHPEEHSGTTMSSYVPGAAQADAPVASHGTEASASTEQPGAPMDMTSLCVAVLLSVWVLAALVRAALSRRTDRTATLRARINAGLRPNPPPPRAPDLTQLSVLRQ